ncbi:MAG: hypothetical protein IJR83_06430 [Clostridia bacterium]|nr:hypothetical protein [Clostridia bacterium]
MTNGTIFVNDPDVTYLSPKNESCPSWRKDPWELSDCEYRSWHSIVGLPGGTQMISNAMDDKHSVEHLRMLTILTPPAKEKAAPLYSAADPSDCTLQTEGRSCHLLRITSAKEMRDIRLIGSDLHISMGAAEIRREAVGARYVQFELNAAASARDGTLYFVCRQKSKRVWDTGVSSFEYDWEEGFMRIRLTGRARKGVQTVGVRV